MPKLLLLLIIFNTVAGGVIFAAVVFLAFAFYLGNRETYQLLKEHLAESFFLRTYAVEISKAVPERLKSLSTSSYKRNGVKRTALRRWNQG